MNNEEFAIAIERDAQNILESVNTLINATRFDLDTATDEKLVAEYKKSVRSRVAMLLTNNVINL